jgi:hypothetical protein
MLISYCPADVSKLNPVAKGAISSVRVGAGVEALLYDGPTFSGKVIRFPPSSICRNIF